MHGDVGRQVKRAGVALPAEEGHARSEVPCLDQPLAFRAGFPVAGEPEPPVDVCREPGGDFHQFALVLPAAKHRHAQQHEGAGAGAVFGAQRHVARQLCRGREDERIVDDGDFAGRQRQRLNEPLPGGMAVGDHVAHGHLAH